MPFMIWGPMFEVGVQQIDTQHRKLFDLANELAEAVRDGRGIEPLDKILTGLTSYTQTHFASEEQLMTHYGYPATAEHKAYHQELIKQVTEFKRAFNAGDVGIVDSILQFFTDWLAKHIMETDKALARDLKQKGVQ